MPCARCEPLHRADLLSLPVALALYGDGMKIRVQQNFFALFYAPLYVARRQGHFTEAGIDLDLQTGLMPIDNAAGVAAGTLDLLWAGPIRVLRALELDPATPLRYIAEGVRRDPFVIVGRQPRPKFRLDDLTRLRFAQVSEVPTPWMCLSKDIRDNGIDPASIQRPAAATMAENVARLRRGEVDAIQVFEPFVSELEQGGEGHVWYEAANRGPNAYSGFVGPAPLLAQHPDLASRLRRAMNNALRWTRAESPAAVAAVLAPDFPDVAPDLIVRAVARYQRLNIWADTSMPDPIGLARLAGMAQAFGLITTPPPASKVFA